MLFKKPLFILIIILTLFAFTGCKKNNDMSGVKNLIRQGVFEQKEEKYYIFCYRDGCDGCEQTKPYIMAYLKALKDPKYKDCRKLYGLNLSDEKNYTMYVSNKKEGGQGTDGRFWVDGVTNWEDLMIGSTPSLITIYVKDGVKTAQYAAQGKEKICNVLNEQLLTHKK